MMQPLAPRWRRDAEFRAIYTNVGADEYLISNLDATRSRRPVLIAGKMSRVTVLCTIFLGLVVGVTLMTQTREQALEAAERAEAAAAALSGATAGGSGTSGTGTGTGTGTGS